MGRWALSLLALRSRVCPATKNGLQSGKRRAGRFLKSVTILGDSTLFDLAVRRLRYPLLTQTGYVRGPRQCRLLAPLRHVRLFCPFTGVDRKSPWSGQTVAFDPEQTSCLRHAHSRLGLPTRVKGPRSRHADYTGTLRSIWISYKQGRYDGRRIHGLPECRSSITIPW